MKFSPSSTLKSICETLDPIVNDQNTPQNIRKNAEFLSELFLDSGQDLEIKKDKAIQLLEGMIADLNIDSTTRTSLYTTLSLVESLNNGSADSY